MRHRDALIVALVAATAGVAFLLGSGPTLRPATSAATSTATDPRTLPREKPAALAAPTRSGSDTGSPAECTSGRLVLTTADTRKTTYCSDPALASQNGATRRYAYRYGQDGSGRLDIEMVAGTVTRVELVDGDQTWHCEARECVGLRFGRPDFNGVQTVDLQATLLKPASGTDDHRLMLDASLSALGNVAASCAAGVTLNFNDNSYTRFCALGGNGFSRGDDGLPVYVFRDLDGGSIEFTTDAQGAIRRVELSSEALACEATQCAGSSFLPPDQSGNRIMQFTGTELRSADGERSVVMNGGLVLNGE